MTQGTVRYYKTPELWVKELLTIQGNLPAKKAGLVTREPAFWNSLPFTSLASGLHEIRAFTWSVVMHPGQNAICNPLVGIVSCVLMAVLPGA